MILENKSLNMLNQWQNFSKNGIAHWDAFSGAFIEIKRSHSLSSPALPFGE
ncbi:MAG: hypothetical protein VXY27_04010 [Thermoproteota archaeon]|nr:hypothetical protein [Thermoproteota archaeon]